MQLVTTSCFLNSESSHSLALVSWSVFRVCERRHLCVLWVNVSWGGLHVCNVQSQFFSTQCGAPVCAANLIQVHGKNAQITFVFCVCVCVHVHLCKCVYQCSFMCECGGCVYGGMVQHQNKMSVPFFFWVACVEAFFLRYQETDASSTILASCCNLPAQLNNNMWELRSHCLLISASLFCALS